MPATSRLAADDARCDFADYEALARPATLAAGEAARGCDRDDRFVFVRRGATKLVASASHGREQILGFHFTGDIAPVPGRSHHVYTLVALQPTSLLIFSAADLLEAAQAEPRLSGVLLARALLALGRCREKTITLGRKTAQERLADFLLSMAARIGTPDAGGLAIDLPMSRRDIADSLGLTIETVSRQLGELRAAGLITTEGRSGILITRPQELALRCGYVREPDADFFQI